jgi:DNA modification methylase
VALLHQLSIFELLEEEKEEKKQKKYNFSKKNDPYVKFIVNNGQKHGRLKFEALKSVNNPKSIHGIYPYRGKISAIDAKQILEQLPKNSTLLDPFCGSGTILFEGQKLGMNVIGVDNNPIAYDLSKAKLDQQPLEKFESEVTKLIEKAETLLKEGKVRPMPEAPSKHFHEQSAKEIMSVAHFIDEMSDYVKGCYYGAIALTARGCNHYKWTSSTVGKNIEPKQYINFYDKLLSKVKKHYEANLDQPKGRVYLGDSRKLSEFIAPKSVDIVFTSPPYFDALDYTSYYAKIIYEIHEIDRLEIKAGLIQKFNDYKEDMIKVLEQIDIVTKDDAIIIFVVGDKKTKDGIIDGGEFFASLRDSNPTYIAERVYSGSQSQIFDTLNNTNRKEQIIVWHKTEGF